MDKEKLLPLAKKICAAYKKEDLDLWSLSEGIKIQKMVSLEPQENEEFLKAVYDVCKSCSYKEPGEAEFLEMMK